MRPSVSVVQSTVRSAKMRCAGGVSASAVNVSDCAANHVLKKVSAQIAEKQRRIAMKKKLTNTNKKKSCNRLSARFDLLDDEPREPVLRFSPTAWAKLIYFRDKSDNEVGGFAITEPDDLLFVTDFVTVKQEVTPVSVEFDDESVADFFDAQVDQGRKPEQFARIWLHTHPGDSCEPSGTDQHTFKRVFGNCQWAVMCILAQDNSTYARLSFNVGPGGHVLIPTAVDYSCDFGPADHDLWDAEYATNVKAVDWFGHRCSRDPETAHDDLDDYALPYDFINEFEQMEPEERQFVLDELADRPELWDEESEVMVI